MLITCGSLRVDGLSLVTFSLRFPWQFGETNNTPAIFIHKHSGNNFKINRAFVPTEYFSYMIITWL